MPTNSFGNICANELEEIQMIAGDEQELVYTMYDVNDGLLELSAATCTVLIFKYGDPTNLLFELDGTVTGSSATGEFTASFPSSSSIDLSGVYQQQAKIVDYLGKTHIPMQGKIIIFPSPGS